VPAGLKALGDDHVVHPVLFQPQPLAHRGRGAYHLRAFLLEPADESRGQRAEGEAEDRHPLLEDNL
jgi:hypothetical protein